MPTGRQQSPRRWPPRSCCCATRTFRRCRQELGGRHITHVRVAFSRRRPRRGRGVGAASCGRSTRCVLDTRAPDAVRGGRQHPPRARRRTRAGVRPEHPAARLRPRRRRDPAATHAGPGADAPFLVELRAWGGALSRPPATPNAVAGQGRALLARGISDRAAEHRSRRDDLLDAMRPWGTGKTFLNFAGVDDTSVDQVRRAYDDADFDRLRRIKAALRPGQHVPLQLQHPAPGLKPPDILLR